MADIRSIGPDNEDDVIRRSEVLEIANEFSLVRVSKVWTQNGERLEISAVKAGSLARLDSLELESLTRQKPEVFTDLIRSASEN